MHGEPECALHRIGRVAKLPREPGGSEERNPGRVPTQGEALPRKPDVEVQNAGRVGQHGEDLTLHGHSVLADFMSFACL